jgi:dTDP-4-amino-4,6-dideoxygalactose transaminase
MGARYVVAQASSPANVGQRVPPVFPSPSDSPVPHSPAISPPTPPPSSRGAGGSSSSVQECALPSPLAPAVPLCGSPSVSSVSSVVPSAVVPESAGKLLHAGFGGQAAVFSFNGNKIITTSGGGMLASHDPDLIAHARKLSTQARDPAPHYEHTEIGYNYRMSNIVAAIGRGQLRVLDHRVERKRQIFATYQQHLGDLPGITFMPEASTGRCNRWLTVILIDPAQFGCTNDQVRLALEAENIESRPVWKPMHLQPVFRGCRMRGGAVSQHLFANGLCLPSGTAMTDADLARVTTIIRRRRAKK